MEAPLQVELPAHSKLGASGTHRWFNCHGSVALIESLKVGGMAEEASEYASAGTSAHDIAAICLTSNSQAEDCVGFYDNYDADDATAVQVYLDGCRQITTSDLYLPGEVQVLVEERFHLPEVHPDFFGTTDCTIITPARAYVKDYKHGAGIAVDAKGNSQLRQYAVGALYRTEHWKNDDYLVGLYIYQPRAFHPDGPVRKEWTTIGELKRWLEDEWLANARATEDPNATLNPGTWCHKSFCSARTRCPALRALIKRVAAITPEEIKAMDDWELGLMAQECAIAASTKRLFEEEVFNRLRAGNQVPGWKIVKKKSDRVFKSEINEEDGTVKKLAEAVWDVFGNKATEEPKLKSVATIERMPGGKEFVAKWAYKPDTGQTVAPDTDTRTGETMRNRESVFAGVLQGYGQ